MDDFPEPMAGLVREHRLIEEVVSAAREALGKATAPTAEAAAIDVAVERVLDLDAFLAEDLARHIEKEEEVLFPAVRGFNAEMELAVEDMLAQHDEVRQRRAMLVQTLDRLDAEHERVEAEKAHLRQAASELGDGAQVTHELLVALRERVRQLDAILQGHFGDEEDGVFGPAAELLSGETLSRLTAEMEAIDVRSER